MKIKKSKKVTIIFLSLLLLLLGVGIGVGIYFVLQEKETSNNNKENRPDNGIEGLEVRDPTLHSDAKDYLFNNVVESDIGARSTVFNVGQNDSSLIQIKKSNNNFVETENNENFDILIDAGTDGKRDKLAQRIWDKGVRTIDLVVITHAHLDHLNASKYLVEENKEKTHGSMINSNTTVLCNFQEYLSTKASKSAKEAMQAFLNANAKFVDAKDIASRDNNKIVDFGKWGYFSVLTPIKSGFGSNQNDWSIINRFEFNNKSTLYTGDATGNTIKTDNWLSNHQEQFNTDFLKSPHHGSSSEKSNNMEFLKMVTPSEVWISAGTDSSYKLPNVDALNNYLNIGIREEEIKGTRLFGDLNNPSVFGPLNDWVLAHPRANNSNKGFGDIIKIYK